MKKGLSKFFSILLVVCMIVSMIPAAVFAATPSVLYLKPNSEWLSDGARFAAYFFGNSGDAWVSMTDSDGDGYYEATVPSGYSSVIFCRMNGSATENNWDNKWNQSSDLEIPTDGKNCWTLNSGDWNGGGAWSKYTVSTPSTPTTPTQVDYYLFGFINGANYGCEEDASNMGAYKFNNGSLTVTFDSDSYVGIKTTNNASWYMTQAYVDTTSATLYNTTTGSAEKMFVPGGVEVTFTLKVNSNDTLTLSYGINSGSCSHPNHNTDGDCTTCGAAVNHNWGNGTCITCGTACKHEGHDTNGNCTTCGSTVNHSYKDGTCSVCGKTNAYYLFGFINGANYACEEDAANIGIYKFNNGSLTVTFDSDSYVGVKTGDNVSWYMTDGWAGEVTSVTLYNTNNLSTTDKLYVPGGVQVTFTLKVNSNDTLTLSYKVNSSSCSHRKHSTDGICTTCGETVSHSYSNGSCTVCGKTCSHSYKNGTCTICGAACGHSNHSTSGVCKSCGITVEHNYVNNKCTICGITNPNATSTVKIHFVNTLGWTGVVAYPWTASGSTMTPIAEWPGVTVNRDDDGYFTLELDYKPTSGQSLGVVFHNFAGSQTADVVIDYATLSASSEFWIKPDTYTNDEGKYGCAVSTSQSTLVTSPEINGTRVTFRYANSSASSVYLAGSFNDWSSTANKMTKSNGVWTTTLTLAEGAYEYKFVVDGEWIHDPSNGIVGGYDNNSIVTVGGSSTDKITIKFHFYREGENAYDDWDVWFWDSLSSGAGTFEAVDGDKGMVATYTLDGTANSSVGYTVRKTDWSDQEFYDRFIDLSDVESGTIHFFLNAGVETGSRILGNDVVMSSNPTYANLDYDSGRIWVKTPMPVSGSPINAFSIVDAYGNATDITVTAASLDNWGYSLTLSRKLKLTELHNLRVKCGTLYSIRTDGLFYSDGFAADFTYYGNDLGATWSKNSTTFKVWAPTATNVQVLRYRSGNYGTNDQIETVNMTLGEKGVWSATVYGNLDGTYYTYLVTFPTYQVETVDPYAKSTGANGDRGMVLNMDATDPEGWENDVSPNQGMNYTDAIIYEMHVREMTIDESSGVKDEWKGKYLGMTQTGTNYEGRATALDHLKELGITHVQLMPVYDFAANDEYHLEDWEQYNWGYDPEHYNVPEGSYATDPYNGEVRVNEFKQMVQTFHSNGINVVMDVVYNHTFSGGDWCYNKIVPTYFSRFWGENNWSNGSGCGNDVATERSMARNYIVDSMLYWVEEYHVDGFRFDYAGLIDTVTMNEIISTIQAKYPYVIFYGEGWHKDSAVEPGYNLANQGNAWMTGSLAFYNDSIRNTIAGDNGHSWGFATGDTGKADALANYFRASNGWSTSPSQTINYVSAHDNHTLIDKIIISRNGAYWEEMVRMNNLSAAIYMMAQGIPYIYSGEEVLREKVNEDGYRIDNAHGTNDYVNKIRWSDLVNKDYAQVTDDYYAGLVAFRKNHAALRNPDGANAWNYTSYYKINDQCIMFYISGYPNYECSDGIVIIYNASNNTQWVNLGDYGLPWGYYQACVHGMQAGISPLWGLDVGGYGTGSVGVEGISTTILVLGDLVHEESVYNNQNYSCSHDSHTTSGLCTTCGRSVSHTYSNGSCTVCGLPESAPDTITVYYDNSTTDWSSVYIYSWAEAGGKNTEYTGGWPGSTMTHVGDSIYSIELPIGATNVIFSDGSGSQTVNLTAPAYTSGETMFDPSTESWAVPTLPEATYYVAGSMNEWNCAADGYLMAQSGLAYTIDLTLAAGDHSFKVTDGTWDNAWPSDNYTLSLDVRSRVTITFNPNTKSITTSVKALEEACNHTSHNTSGVCTNCGETVGHTYSNGTCTVCGKSKVYYLNGYINGADYSGTDYQFVNGSLTTTLSEGSYVYICDNGGVQYMTQAYVDKTTGTFYNTSTGAGEKMYVPGGTQVTFTLVANSDGSLTLSYVTSDEPTPVPTDYYLAGTMNGWAEKNADYQLVQDGDVYKITVALATGEYEFKITDGTWDNAWPSENYALSIPADSNVTITFNPATGEITVDGIEDAPVVKDSKDIKWQITSGTNANSSSTNLRLVSWVDSVSNYSSVTFNVTINGRTAPLVCTTAYTAIKASGLSISNPSRVFGEESANYFVTHTIMGIPTALFDSEILVTVTWTDLEGNSVTSDVESIVISSDWA